MNPKDIFCPSIDCLARGQVGKGNIGIHSQEEERYICDECQQTFTATKGTIFYRLRTDPKIVLQVITLLAYGCPIQAIVQAMVSSFHRRIILKLVGMAIYGYCPSCIVWHILRKSDSP